MYIEKIKLFAQNEKELETLIKTKRIYSQDIGMEFSIENVPCYNEKWKRENNRRKITFKSRKNARRKGNIHA